MPGRPGLLPSPKWHNKNDRSLTVTGVGRVVKICAKKALLHDDVHGPVFIDIGMALCASGFTELHMGDLFNHRSFYSDKANLNSKWEASELQYVGSEILETRVIPIPPHDARHGLNGRVQQDHRFKRPHHNKPTHRPHIRQAVSHTPKALVHYSAAPATDFHSPMRRAQHSTNTLVHNNKPKAAIPWEPKQAIRDGGIEGIGIVTYAGPRCSLLRDERQHPNDVPDVLMNNRQLKGGRATVGMQVAYRAKRQNEWIKKHRQFTHWLVHNAILDAPSVVTVRGRPRGRDIQGYDSGARHDKRKHHTYHRHRRASVESRTSKAVTTADLKKNKTSQSLSPPVRRTVHLHRGGDKPGPSALQAQDVSSDDESDDQQSKKTRQKLTLDDLSDEIRERLRKRKKAHYGDISIANEPLEEHELEAEWCRKALMEEFASDSDDEESDDTTDSSDVSTCDSKCSCHKCESCGEDHTDEASVATGSTRQGKGGDGKGQKNKGMKTTQVAQPEVKPSRNVAPPTAAAGVPQNVSELMTKADQIGQRAFSVPVEVEDAILGEPAPGGEQLVSAEQEEALLADQDGENAAAERDQVANVMDQAGVAPIVANVVVSAVVQARPFISQDNNHPDDPQQQNGVAVLETNNQMDDESFTLMKLVENGQDIHGMATVLDQIYDEEDRQNAMEEEQQQQQQQQGVNRDDAQEPMEHE